MGDARGVQLVETMIAVIPRPILNRDAAVRPGFDLHPRILVVVQPIALDHVCGGAVDADPDRPANRLVGVSERFVVLDRAVPAPAAGAVREHDPVIRVVRDRVLLDQHIIAAGHVDSVSVVERAGVVPDRDEVGGAAEPDRLVIAVRSREPVNRHVRAPGDIEGARPLSHESRTRPRVGAPDVHVEALPRDPHE